MEGLFHFCSGQGKKRGIDIYLVLRSNEMLLSAIKILESNVVPTEPEPFPTDQVCEKKNIYINCKNSRSFISL